MCNVNIYTKFQETSNEFICYCESLDDSTYFKIGEKWNAAEVVDHLQRSVNPVNIAMSLPSFILILLFGRSNRSSKSYNELIEKYKRAIQKGGVAGKKYIPKGNLNNRQKNIEHLKKQCAELQSKIRSRKIKDWDNCILPHPLIGKLTLLEMIFFTSYHIEHHLNTLRFYNENN